MYRIVIDLDTERSAEYLKEQIEKQFPLVDGKVKIIKDAEIKPLNKVIEDMKRQGNHA